MYGRQDVNIYCERPFEVSSDRKDLLVVQVSYDEPARKLTVMLESTDYQGVTGTITLLWT
jgi:hypothetical protein